MTDKETSKEDLELEKQQTKAENELKYYQGKEKTFLGQFQYWTLGGVAWTYNWCSIKPTLMLIRVFSRSLLTH